MKLRSIFTVILGSLMLAESASALSCMRPDLGATMEKAKASDKLYYIFVGTFRPQNPVVTPKPPQDYSQQGTPTLTRMWFDGRSIGPKPHHDTQLTRFPLEVQTSCAGPWCGAAPTGNSELIAFIEARPGMVPLLRVGACPEWMYHVQPDDGKVEKLRDCFDKPCKSERPDYR